MSIPEHSLFLDWVDYKTVLAEAKARLRREQERRATKWGAVSEPAKKLLETVGFQNCLQHIMRTGWQPEEWYLRDTSFAGASYPRPVASWFRPFCYQTYQVTNAGPFHSHTMYTNSELVRVTGHGILLQCERCSRFWNDRLRPVPASLAGNALLAHPISYVQCPSNIGGWCEGDATYSWRLRQTQLDAERNQCLAAFESVFLSASPAILADHIFECKPRDGGHEVLEGYLAWRKIWHSRIFRGNALPLPGPLSTLLEHMKATVEELQLWGDVINDGHLFEYGHLDKKTLVYTYDQDPESVLYLVRNRQRWANECCWLNDYVGCRRWMGTAQFNLAKKAVQRAGAAMRKLVVAEAQRTGEPSTGVNHRDNLEVEARLRFQEIRSAVLADPWQAFYRTEIVGCRLGRAAENTRGGPSRC